MPRFWNARLELVNQKKGKEEQAKREIEKENRLKKKKDLKSPSPSVEELDDSNENKSELAKQQESILTKKRENYGHRSSSSESDVPVSPGLALSHEMRKNQLFKSHERLDEKKSPPPVLPKPKPKPKPKLPPANKNPATVAVQPINSHAMQEIANEISQMKLKNNKKNKLAKASSSDSDSVDGNVFTKAEVKTPPKRSRKPIQHAKSVDFNEVHQVTENTKTWRTHNAVKTTERSKSHDEKSQSVKDDKVSDLARPNVVSFEELSDTQAYSKMQNAPGSSREETASTPREILLNLKEKGVNLMMNKKRVLSNMCWPLNCQNDTSQDDEDPLYSTVNFAALGYNNSSGTDNTEEYKETSEVNIPQCTNTAFPNPIYSPPNSSPPKTDLSNVVQISTDLGIKDVQSIVKGGTSYTVGDNMDLYSLPVKRRTPSTKDDTKVTASPEKSPTGKCTSEKNILNKNTAMVITPDDTYSEPLVSSPRKVGNYISESSDNDAVTWGFEGPYAQTVLFEQPEDQSESHYDIPDILIDTAPSTTFDLKPPNFKPPPPPPGGSPILSKKNKKKQNSPVVRNKNKVKAPKKAILKDAPSPKDKTFQLGMKRSQSESDLTSEPIFATPSSIGITNEDKNNNRHSMFVAPKEAGKLREYHVYSDEDYEQTNDIKSAVSDRELRHHVGNGREQIGNVYKNTEKYEDHPSFPAIVPPPPSSTLIIDTDSMVAPPPPRITPSEVVPPHPIYPPPRLHPTEKALLNVNSISEETRWQEIIESLPPPPPDLLES